MAASLGNSVLGQFGMGGRIGDAVREKAGLAYYAYSSVSAGHRPGLVVCQRGSESGKRQESERFDRQGIEAIYQKRSHQRRTLR